MFRPLTPVCLSALALSLAAFAAPALAQKAAAPASAQQAAVSRPTWGQLDANQRQALAPLAGSWEQLTEQHKRKWIALASNFSKQPATEQAKMHGRMAEWVALSPQQRTQARLNFGEASQISPDEKKAKWEAYQALPAEEKRKLAAGAASAPPATAAAVRPVPSSKLANVPKPTADDPKPARIVVVPPGEAVNPTN